MSDADRVRERGYTPIVARTSTSHRLVGPVAYDCVKLIAVRDGSAILYSKSGIQHVHLGDVAVVAPCTLFCSEPEGWLTSTTLCLDRDFLVDQIFWQHAEAFVDRLDAREFLETCLSCDMSVLPLGESRAGSLMPWLDELVTLTVDGPRPDRFFRAQSLLLAVLDVLTPHFRATERHRSETVRRTAYPAAPRHRSYVPVRVEAQRAAGFLREAPERRWTLNDLAEAVHLSPSQLGRLFVESFGKTPVAFLTILRAEKMALLLRTTDLSITQAAHSVGWADPDYAGRQFRRCVGLAPRDYRALARRVPPAGRTGGSPH